MKPQLIAAYHKLLSALKEASKDGRLLLLFFFVLLTFLAQDHTFFWDTVQFAGKHGQWFYDNDFQNWMLPPEIDSGHPPGFGWYLAGLWLIFGKSMAVSHWAMFPFLLGIVCQLFGLAKLLLKNSPVYYLPLIVIADPVFLGQSILVSPDIPLLFFFLLALKSMLTGKLKWRTLAYLGLVFLSMRGMMIVAAFGLFELWSRRRQIKFQTWFQRFKWLATYLPAACFSLTFLIVHYKQTAWIGYHSDSPWALSFERVDLPGFVRNLAILGWRWLDYGRIFMWLALAYLLYKNKSELVKQVFSNITTVSPPHNNITSPYHHLTTSPDHHLTILSLLIPLVLLLSIPFLSYRGLQAHRYLLPAFLIFSLFSLILADQLKSRKRRNIVLTIFLAGFLSGNLWVYPERIAQGWDSSLAHWPYYELRQQMLDYLESEDVALSEVGTAFPDIGPLNDRDLSGEMHACKTKDLQLDQWIWYSNVMNDFSEEELDELQQHWIEQKRFQSWSVVMILYRKAVR